MRTLPRFVLLAAAIVFGWVGSLEAEDHYFVVSVGDLKIVEGELPQFKEYEFSSWAMSPAVYPYASLDGPGEIYVGLGDNLRAVSRIAVRAPAGREVTGRLFIPRGDAEGSVIVKFSIPASQGRADRRDAFLRAKLRRYDRLHREELAGAAWFRHQGRATAKQLGLKREDRERLLARAFSRRWQRRGTRDTFALVSGGRAVSENLQLDRTMPPGRAVEATVPIDSIEGITVRGYDWEPVVKDLHPESDRLAALIPADQHALFFTSFQAMLDLADHATTQGTPVLRMAEPRAEDAQTRKRYERQLCLDTSAVSRLLGPKLIKSVAITGADPYLRTGADVAVLFEAIEVDALKAIVHGRIVLGAQAYPEAKPVQGDVEGVAYAGMRSPDRVICSYTAALGDAVVVTNSLAQLRRLVEVHQGGAPSLVSLPEYTFFRDRYRYGDGEETALLVISDAAIRRWCGPRWRIGSSRRVRAAAVMSELEAEHLEQLVEGTVQPGSVESAFSLPDAGTFVLTPGGIQSSVYGTLAFQTPIVELDLTQVTEEEDGLYRRWRDGYQRNWSQFFDPIAVRFYASGEKLAADVSVMPLIAGTRYSRWIDVSQGAKIAADAGDPHAGALMHFALAINHEAPQVKQGTNLLRLMAPQIKTDPLGWMGETVAVYLDDDPVWADLAQAEEPDRFVWKNVHRIPVALHVEVKSGIKLAVFLAGVRAYAEQSAPEMTLWETKSYRDEPYVKVSPSERAKSDEEDLDEVALYYSASGKALIVTLSESVLKRALDRKLDRKKAKDEGQTAAHGGRRWLGENLCVQVERKFIQVLEGISAEHYHKRMRDVAWSNLPILNEWKKLYPDQNPTDLHAKIWKRQLVCPGGGNYRWNDTWQTMESTVYGHPGEPKVGASMPKALSEVQVGNFGLTFEKDGLRARAELQRGGPQKPAD